MSYVTSEDSNAFDRFFEVKKRSSRKEKKLTCLDRESNPGPFDPGDIKFCKFQMQF